MLIFTCLLAFYVAWNLGANDVANSMGTSVGSKAITLRQALIIAGILEFTGAVVFGREVSERLATGVLSPALFADAPRILLLGMLAVLVACGLWLQIATAFGLPVASSHAAVGAIAGFGWVAAGTAAVNWSTLGLISVTWVLTPVFSGAIAALFYAFVQRWILQQPDPISQLREWIPWLSATLLGIFGTIVLPTLTEPLQAFFEAHWGWQLPAHDLPLVLGAIAAISLTLVSWRRLDRWKTEHPEIQPEQIQPGIESQIARFQVLSACFVAFAHGSNDVSNAISPLAAIAHILQTGTVPLSDFQVPVWILALGGAGIVGGLAVWGKRVITTIGENITVLRPSGGFCAELATATTILLASRWGLPVSTSHALVGGVVGVGLLRDRTSLKLKTLQEIGLAWLVTLPIAASLSVLVFLGLRSLLA